MIKLDKRNNMTCKKGGEKEEEKMLKRRRKFCGRKMLKWREETRTKSQTRLLFHTRIFQQTIIS
jgi:hypothetical protein